VTTVRGMRFSRSTIASAAGVAAGGGAAMTTDDARRGDSVAHTATQQPQAAARAPRRPAKPAAGWVFGAAVGAFFAALALLAFQVRTGQDPALGSAQPTAQAQTKPRRALIRRVIKRVVIHHPPSNAAAPSSPAAVQPSAPATTTTTPPPAPAPLTTQSS